MDDRFDPFNLFERTVANSPERIALSIGTSQWTYRELHKLALAYSAWCANNSPEKGRVAVFARRTVEAYAAILGILHSGRSYVPIHPDHPPERWRRMIDAASVSEGSVAPADIALATGITGVQWCSDPPEVPVPELRSDRSAEAYVMFTSGSTGGPKGVPVGRAQVAEYLRHQLSTYEFHGEDRFSQFFALTFDLSVHDLFICWAVGGRLCVPSEDQPLRSAAFAREERITVWFSVPSQVDLLRRVRALPPDSLPDLRLAFFCGEVLSAEVVSAFQLAAPDCRVINLYGPTETTIAITAHTIDRQVLERSGTIAIGRPFPGHLIRLEDRLEDGKGELLIAGPQVNAGYLNDPAATGKAFVEMDGCTWYRTGDLVRIDAEGIIHFICRTDDQVKIMGHRVEPAEVDQILAPAIAPAISITLPVQVNGTFRLVTFIDAEVESAPLFLLLRRDLPLHMIPDRIVKVDRFPYSVHGKVDRRALLDRLTDQ